MQKKHVIVKAIGVGFMLWVILLNNTVTAQIDYSLAHLKAHCIGGKSEVKRIIEQEMIYPQQALDEKMEGTVELCFVVTADSLVKELSVHESAGEMFDQEAIRIFRLIQWVPAFYNGEPIVTFNCMKIQFSLRAYKKMVKKRGYAQVIHPVMPVDTSYAVYPFLDVDKGPLPDLSDEPSGNIVDFLAQNITYPETALKNNLSGTVKIRFIIEPHGMITNIHPVKTVAGGCTEETIRVLKMIRWKPGIHNNQIVRTQAEITINFNLPGGGRYQIVPILVRGMIN